MQLTQQEKANVVRAMAGDQQAFEALIARFARIVYAQSFAIVHDREEAEDLVQETFVKAYTYRVSLADPERFPQWLLAIARNLARDRLRRRRPVHHDDGETLRQTADDSVRSPLRAMVVVDDLARLEALMSCLPQHYQDALRWRYVDGLDHDTLRQRLGVTEGSLRGILCRGLSRLRRLMEAR